MLEVGLIPISADIETYKRFIVRYTSCEFYESGDVHDVSQTQLHGLGRQVFVVRRPGPRISEPEKPLNLSLKSRT